jgi:predicted TIM-barrel fold metal-dependent hydrolase
MAIVDFHLHLFSRPYFEALAAQSPLEGDVEAKLARAAGAARIEIPPRALEAHVARWIAELDAGGVERAAAFASAPEEIPAVAEAARIAGGRLVPFALVDPRKPGVPERVARLMDEQGFRGVLLFPALHHYHVGSAEAAPLFSVLDERAGIAYVHCGILIVRLRDLLGLPRAQDLAYANPLGVIPAANAAPRARFVIPHFGAGLFREALIAGAQCPNVLVDSSSSNSWMATQAAPLRLRDVFERTLAALGSERILFGTDSNTFPAGWRKDRYLEQLAACQSLGLSPRDLDAIFAANARRLLQGG